MNGGEVTAIPAPMHFISAKVIETQELAAGYSLLRLDGCGALAGARPGQFAMLRGDWGRDPILPRAYSILAVDGQEARFLVRQVGRGSRLLGRCRPGAELTVLGPLGNSFPAPEPGVRDLLVAGGCGLPPLHMAALKARECAEVLVGTRRGEDLLRPLLDELQRRQVPVHVATEDGSSGHHGLVTELLEQRLVAMAGSGERQARVFACGPTAMLRAVREVARSHRVSCHLSLEAEMACGLGACLGCAVERPGTSSASGGSYAHVCSDGPVFDAEEIWP